jgi:cytochrome P450
MFADSFALTYFRATRDTILPVATPIKTLDGGEINEIFIPKGQEIFISLFDCNRDPEIWGPDAEEWKPDRWLSPLPSSVTQSRVPGIYSNL